MQWIYLICFILLSAGLLALFGVKPGDFIDAFFRSQRKSATLSDELNVLLGTPAKGFFNQDYELKQILKGTGRADRYEAIKRLSLIPVSYTHLDVYKRQAWNSIQMGPS